MNARRQQQKVETMHRQAEPKPVCAAAGRRPERVALSTVVPCKIQRVAVAMKSTGVIDTVRYPVAHVVEEVGGIDWMNEVEVPTEEYYDAFVLFLQKEFPGACPHVREHMVSLTAFLHKSRC
jgi:hypothetical protein